MDNTRNPYYEQAMHDAEQMVRFTIVERGMLHPESYGDPKQDRRVRWVLSQMKGRVLDIGCGIGYILTRYSGEGVGLDYNPYHIAVAQFNNQRDNQAFYCVDADYGIPFPDKSFTVAVLAEVLEHMVFSHATRLLKDTARCATDGVILTFPFMREGAYNLPMVESMEHKWSTTREVIDRLVREAGLKATVVETLCDETFLGMVVGR